MDGSKDACTALMVGRALLRRPNFRKNKRSDVLARPAASIAVLAGGEVRAKRQLCPTKLVASAKMCPSGNRACRKVILRYHAFRLWRKTSRQTKTA
jgi:hypothetical protein